jgi:diaminohydroxyphosphoribosylaminopyrimidine deaminase/5-amino-6-(5-phosphoribosylamino)uracil reductase
MGLALELARRGLGSVEPNPMVGCVVVQDDKLIGAGYHQRFGGPHAEVNALANTGQRDLSSATLYVTLEPCSHFGKTPPCVELLLKTPPKRVVVGMLDPFPAVAGRGIQALRDAAIHVDVGVLEDRAKLLNAPYLKLLKTASPWTIAKWAMSLDGAIATNQGDSKWISNEASRRVVHELRSRVDAIVVGIGTAIADNPLLNARLPHESAPKRIATRVILDRQGRLPPQSHLVQSASSIPTLIAVSERNAQSPQLAPLRDAGCDILIAPEEHGLLSLRFVLNHLGSKRFTNVLLEGGSQLLGHAFDHQLIDEAHCFVAPILIGGSNAYRPLSGAGHAAMQSAVRLQHVQSQTLGDNVYIQGILRAP